MMPLYLDGILIVEGKQDKAFLSNYIKSPIITINGLDFKSKWFSVINKCSDKGSFILLVDPDDAGDIIRNNFNEKYNVDIINVNEYKHARGKKQGIAECDIKCILKTLEPHIVESNAYSELDTSFLYKVSLLGERSSTNRRKVCNYLNVSYMDGKDFKTMLEIFKISKEKLLEILEDGNK